MPAAYRSTYWHVTEIMDPQDLSRNHRYTVANDGPRRLRMVVAPYLATHRLVASKRRRACSGASFARFELEPLEERGTQLVLHALLISLSAVRE